MNGKKGNIDAKEEVLEIERNEGEVCVLGSWVSENAVVNNWTELANGMW